MTADFSPVIEVLQGLSAQPGPILVSIDGPSASMKSSVAAEAKRRLACTVFAMDDFFLPPAMRTAERLAQPGGNVHYERFYEEVLTPLLAGGPVFYRRLDCRTGRMLPGRWITPLPLVIVEGVYSNHPYFGQPYRASIFLSVPPAVQRARILARESAAAAEMFFRRWIPLEQQYFAAYTVRENARYVFDSTLFCGADGAT